MRIAYFNANLRVGQDGVTRCIYTMIDAALAQGHEPIAITSTLPETEPTIPMYKVRSVVLPLQKNYRIAYPGYSSFARILQDFQPDLLHINSPCTLGFAAAKYGRHFGVPVVATYHTHFPTYPRYYNLTRFEDLTWKLTRSLYNGLDRTFVPTRPILDELVLKGIRGLEYLPNGVDTTLFHPAKRSAEWRRRFGNGDRPIVLFVSRLVWEKDLKVLADMYARLQAHRSDFEMVVVGDGHARAELESLMPGAQFLGYQSGEALAQCYASSDIFVFPSTTETFGLVTLEAMASGLVPIAANVGGAVELLSEGKTGFPVAPHDPGDLAKKVEDVLDNQELLQSIGRKAHAHAQSYAWNVVIGQLFSSYARVVGAAREKRKDSRAA